jgi:tetratricopeptide (TPR) repeat protein
VKFRDVAHRGPWTSGGLEYNFGIMSHVSTCATPQDYVVSEYPDGSVSCTIGALDLHTGTKWNVEVLLPKDKAFVKTKASWFNTRNVPVSFYHYMNAAAKTKGNLEFIYPGSHHIGHPGNVGEWPIDNGRNVSLYENNNFGSYKSYHVLNAYSDYMGGYWHDDDFGFGHLVDYADMPGKKLWIWGLSEQGMIWEGLLTDTKGQYIEFQSGKSFNQAMTKSSMTPFKHSEFVPYDSDITTELWFPIKETGGMVAASEYGVLNVIRENDQVKVILSALQSLDTDLIIKSYGKIVKQESIVLSPLELNSTTFTLDENMDFTVEVGEELLYYSSKREDIIVDRPLYSNDEYNWDSAVGLFTRGLELEKQQSYIPGGQANKTAHEYYLKSLEKDRAYAPALNRLALSYYRRIDYQKALDNVNKSLAIDTYDPEANYLFGLINRKLIKYANAKSGFSIAVQSPHYRAAAYTELASLYLAEKKFTKAIENAKKALVFNQYNITALEILAISFQEQGNKEMVFGLLESINQLDKTSTFRKYIDVDLNEEDLSEIKKLITNELPYESYIELAVKLFNYGFSEKSIRVLESADQNALISLWLAYLDKDQQEDWLKSGLDASADFVFPYRDETLAMLEHLSNINDHWKLKYYKALIYWKKGCLDKAEELFLLCNDEPDYAPFYLTKAEFFNDNLEIKKASLQKAKKIDENNWRVNNALIEQYLDDNEFTFAADLARKSFKENPERSVLGLNYSIALLNLGEYRKCVSFLESFELIPFEGAVMGRNVYHEASLRAAFDEMKRKKYKSAIGYAEKALLWPVNLGSGKPYYPDDRMENYILAYCNEKLGRSEKSITYYTGVGDFERPGRRTENALLYLQLLSLEKTRSMEEAQKRLDKAKIEYPDNKYVLWITNIRQGEGSGYDTGELINVEKQQSPINNEFLLLNDLLNIIEL